MQISYTESIKCYQLGTTVNITMFLGLRNFSVLLGKWDTKEAAKWWAFCKSDAKRRMKAMQSLLGVRRNKWG